MSLTIEEKKAARREYDARRRVEKREIVLAIQARSRAKRKDEIKAWHAANYQRNKERIRARNAAWKAANPEAYHASIVRWRANNVEKRARQSRSYAETHRHELNAATREWNRRNPERVRARDRRYAENNPGARAIIRLNRERPELGRVPTSVGARLWRLQSGKCATCVEPLTKFHIDHKIAMKRGGTNREGNLQLLCPFCNASKGAKLPIQFRLYREGMRCVA